MGRGVNIAFRIFERLKTVVGRNLADFFGFAPEGAPLGALNDAEARIDALKARLGRALVERRRLLSDASAHHAHDADAKAEFAIRAGREDLARAALRAKQALEAKRSLLEIELEALDAEIAAIERDLSGLNAGSSQDLSAKLDELDRMIANATGKERNGAA